METFNHKWWLYISSPVYLMKILTALLSLDVVNTYIYLPEPELRIILE